VAVIGRIKSRRFGLINEEGRKTGNADDQIASANSSAVPAFLLIK
jgi:hypothetical protein